MFAAAFADDPDIVVPDVVAVGEHGAGHRVAGEPPSLATVIREGTQEERDHYGELFVRFLFSGPSRTGHAPRRPAPRQLPDHARRRRLARPARRARLRRGRPAARARPARGDGPADPARGARATPRSCSRGCARRASSRTGSGSTRDLLLDYLSPFVEPTQVETFRFSAGVDAGAVRADQQPAGAGVHGRDQAQPAAVVPAHPPHLDRRDRRAQPARGGGAVPGDPARSTCRASPSRLSGGSERRYITCRPDEAVRADRRRRARCRRSRSRATARGVRRPCWSRRRR